MKWNNFRIVCRSCGQEDVVFTPGDTDEYINLHCNRCDESDEEYLYKNSCEIVDNKKI